jgi:hypothetical protein
MCVCWFFADRERNPRRNDFASRVVQKMLM